MIPEWQYLLKDDDTGESFSVVGDNVVTSSDEVPLPHTPDGWQDLGIGYERDFRKVGILRNFSVPLSFVLEGAKILRSLFYGSNIERNIKLLIKRVALSINSALFSFDYNYFYDGFIDLSTFKDGGYKVSVSISEGSLAKKLKANEATTYEFPLSDPEAIRVLMDGIFLYETINFISFAGNHSGRHLIGVIQTTVDGQASGVASFSVNPTPIPSSYNFSTSEDYFLTTAAPITGLRVKGRFKATVVDVAGTGGTLYLQSSKGVRYVIGTYAAFATSFDFSFDLTVNTLAGEKLFLYCDCGHASSFTYTKEKITASFKSKYRDTFVYALKPSTLYKRLIGKMTGNEGDAASTLLPANDNLCLISGDGIRSLANSKLKTSPSTFFEAYKVLLGAGQSIEGGKILIEDYAHYFDGSDPIHLGIAKDLTVSPATDLIHNTIKAGYLEKQTDDVNGKFEFNNTHLYTSPIQQVVKELSLICPYNAQPYSIELTRINLEGKTTTDNSNDNEVFILNVDLDNPFTDADGTYYKLKRAPYTSITGVPDTTNIFNIEQLTPKRILLTQKQWINAIFYGFEGSELVFQTTEKNAELQTTLSGVTITEKENLTIDNDRLFIPVYFEFETRVPVNLVALLEANPNCCFSFTWNGITYKGFLVKAAIAPNDNKAQSYKLLATPDNDLTTLI